MDGNPYARHGGVRPSRRRDPIQFLTLEIIEPVRDELGIPITDVRTPGQLAAEVTYHHREAFAGRADDGSPGCSAISQTARHGIWALSGHDCCSTGHC